MVAYDSQQHDALIVAGREGRIAPAKALQQLRQWLAAPLGDDQRRRVASDAIAIAVADGQWADAVAVGRQVPAARLDDYALEPLAVTARRTGDVVLQGDAVKTWRARHPAAREARIHEAFWRLDLGDTVGAQEIYRALAEPAPTALPDRIALLDLRAAMARAQGKPFQALSAYSEITALQPGRRDAQRDADFLLAEYGGASAALEDAQAAQRRQPGSVAPLTLALLEQRALAQRLRWAVKARDQRVGAARSVDLDKVLADQGAALARVDAALAQSSAQDADTWRKLRVQLQSDRMMALLERGRSADTIALYDTLRADGTALPPHALGTAARALAQERRSAEAVPLFERALADLPMPDSLHFGLVYAYLDTNRFDEAEALLQRIEAATPVQMRLAPEAGRPNAQFSEVSGMSAMLQLYGDRPKTAQPRFDALTGVAPLNASYAYGAALTEQMREHPEAALARFEALSVDHPDDLGVRIGHVGALMDTHAFRAARQRAEALEADAPDAAGVREMARKRSAQTGPQLEIDTEGSRGGGTLANREWRIDSRLSSGLIDDAWRVFYAQTLGRADTSEGTVPWARGGLGASWQQDRWLAEGVLQHANGGPYRNSVAGRVDYRASDAWRLSATYDGDSKELPWKARAAPVGAQPIGAREFGSSAAYVVNESRRFDLQWRRLDLSDDNLRDGLDLGWRERWISTPRFQLETRLDADASRSHLQDVRYFSPSQDASAQASVRGQWLSWKSDDRQFFQVIELGGGSYRQAGFGSGPLWSMRYEHRWNLGRMLTLRYGLGVGSHPYDGVRERRRSVFMNLSMPLQ